jgi:SAM-dependent methyltransferase
MNHLLRGMVRAVSETFFLPGPILEIGAYLVPGQEHIANLRELFPGRDYLGMDMRAGPGVDLAARVEAIPCANASVGAVLALNTFEHVQRFWKGLDEIKRVLRPGGALLLSCPFYFHIHNHPNDYWRFTPAALESLLEDYPAKIIGWHGSKKRPVHVWALAFREGRGPITGAEFERYQTLLHRYAREPRSWKRSLAYRVASWFLGRGPFAPYLENNRVETVCLNSA